MNYSSIESYLAFVDVNLATGTGEAGQTEARVGGDAINARPVVLTWIRFALVDVDIAILAGEPGRTDAFVAVDQIVARTIVPARMRQTLVKFQIAIVARESRPAIALIRS